MYGIYLRQDFGHPKPNLREAAGNDLLSGVVLMTPWAKLEPARGSFALGVTALLNEVDWWRGHGKEVVLCVMPYGDAPGPHQVQGGFWSIDTPFWLAQLPTVHVLAFPGSGAGTGKRIALPRVWDAGFVPAFLDPLLAALGTALDGHLAGLCVPCGHIGHLTATPAPDGGVVFQQAGWTPAAWQAHAAALAQSCRRHFPATQLLAVAETVLCRDHGRHDWVAAIPGILGHLAGMGAGVLQLEMNTFVQQGAVNTAALATARANLARLPFVPLGVGDDWPAWVPLSRQSQPPTVGYGTGHLQACLEQAFALGFPFRFLCIQPEEAVVTSKANHRPDEDELAFQQPVYDLLSAARDKLTLAGPAPGSG